MKDTAGHVLSVEQITEAASKRINEIEDPTVRATMAFELFGKSGVKLVDTLKNLDAQKANSKGKILSEDDLAILDSAEKRITSWSGKLTVLGGKMMAAAAVTFGIADPNAGIFKRLEDRKRYENAPDISDDAKIKNAKALTQAMRELKQAQDEQGGTNDATKLFHLMEQERDIQEDLKDQSLSAIERVHMETEAQKKHNEVLAQRAKMQDDANKKAQEAAKNEKESALQLLQMNDEIRKAKEQENDADKKLSDAKEDRSRLSLEDLTNSRFRFRGQLGVDQQTAFQIKRLEAQGEWNRQHGLVSRRLAEAVAAQISQRKELRAAWATMTVQARSDFRNTVADKIASAVSEAPPDHKTFAQPL